jgi:hypothetical protein
MIKMTWQSFDVVGAAPEKKKEKSEKMRKTLSKRELNIKV